MISVSLINYPPPPMHRITITSTASFVLHLTNVLLFKRLKLKFVSTCDSSYPMVFFCCCSYCCCFFLQILVLLVWLFLCNLAKRVTLLTVNVKTCVLVILKSYQRIWEQTISQAGDSGESIQLLSCAPGPAPGKLLWCCSAKWMVGVKV